MIPRHLLVSVVLMLMLTIGMVFYAWKVRDRSVAIQASALDARPVAPPVSGASMRVRLFVAHDDSGTLVPQDDDIPLPEGSQQRAEQLIRVLINIYVAKSSPHPLAPGSDIRSVYLVDPGMAVIDLNEDFADGHRSGILTEELTVASLVETLAANVTGIDRVKILVGGQVRETLAGHADLSKFYEVSNVAQLAEQLKGSP